MIYIAFFAVIGGFIATTIGIAVGTFDLFIGAVLYITFGIALAHVMIGNGND